MKEGATIQPGDVLCEIQTDKAVVAMEYDDEAVLAKIMVKEGDQAVAVGKLIALMVNEGNLISYSHLMSTSIIMDVY